MGESRAGSEKSGLWAQLCSVFYGNQTEATWESLAPQEELGREEPGGGGVPAGSEFGSSELVKL